MEYIAKETVLKMLNKIENAVEDGEGYQFNEWVGYVKELPTEEVQPIVHGRWKNTRDNWGNNVTICSNCLEEWNNDLNDNKTDILKYCPFCGAKMDGKEVEE